MPSSTTDLTAPGTEYDDAGPNGTGLIVQYTAPIGAGTGNYDTFLSIQSNTTTESGFNHDLPPPIDDEGQGNHTHALQIGNIGTAVVNGTTYYVFRLDVNEPNTAPDQDVTLTKLTFFGSTAQATVDPTVNGSGFTQILSLDNPLNLTDHSSGSGTDDYLIFLPKGAVDTALGGNDSADFLTVFAQFDGVDGGFEEFRALPGTPGEVTEAAAIGIVKDTLVFDTSVAQTLTDDMSVEGKTVLAGTKLLWTYTVANGGNVAIPGSDFTVSDNQGVTVTPVLSGGFNVGDTNHDGNLDVNEQWVYVGGDTSTGTAAIDGPYTNTGTASGEFDAGGPNDAQLSAMDGSGYTGVGPQIQIDKVTLVTEGADSGTVDLTTSKIFVGADLTWQYTVTNPGDAPLSNVTVTDDHSGVTPVATLGIDGVHNVGDVNNDGILEHGESWVYTASGTATAGAYTNIGTANGSFTDDLNQTSTPSDTDNSGFTGVTAGIDIDKTTSGIDPLGNPVGPGDGIVVGEGTTVTWHYAVTDNGGLPLSNVVVTDDNGTPGNTLDDFNPKAVTGIDGTHNIGDTNNDGILDTTETWQFTASGPALTGVAYTNIGTASGDATDAIGHEESVTATDASSYTGFTPRTGELTIGYWYNHETAKHGGPAEGAWTPFLEQGNDLINHGGPASVPTTTSGLWLLLGDANGDGVANDAANLWVSFDVAKEVINSSTNTTDARQILFSQAIATQLNIDNLHGLAVTHGGANTQTVPASVEVAPAGLITDAVHWLTGQKGDPTATQPGTTGFSDGSTGNIDANHDGFITAGANKNTVSPQTNVTDYYNGTGSHFLTADDNLITTGVQTGLSSSSQAWQSLQPFVSAHNVTFMEDGEAIKNALMYYNQSQLVPDLTGGFVEWTATSAVTTNLVNDFWQVIP